jgi:hypothetical protein
MFIVARYHFHKTRGASVVASRPRGAARQINQSSVFVRSAGNIRAVRTDDD